MGKKSAGILLFRRIHGALEVLLAHPGGPYWARKDEHAWSIPKGDLDSGGEYPEEPFEAAKREFAEETGATVTGPSIPLSPLTQPGGKVIYAFAVEQDFDPVDFRSNSFSMEWPPRSGHIQEYPEVDRVAWFSSDLARAKLLRGQHGFLDQLTRVLEGSSDARSQKG